MQSSESISVAHHYNIIIQDGDSTTGRAEIHAYYGLKLLQTPSNEERVYNYQVARIPVQNPESQLRGKERVIEKDVTANHCSSLLTANHCSSLLSRLGIWGDNVGD